MAESGAEKSQEPTEKRRKDALKEGDVPQSRELVLALTAMAATGWLALSGGLLVAQMQTLLTDGLTLDSRAITRFEPARGLGAPLIEIGVTLGLLCVGLILAAFASAFAVGDFGWRAGQFAPKGKRINPLSGLKRMVGKHGATELAKALAKVLLLGGAGAWIVMPWFDGSLAATQHSPEAIAQTFADAALTLFALLCLGLFAIAGIDVPAQWLARQKRLRMSLQEVKDEHRQSDGAPELKMRLRQRRMELLSHPVRQAVAEATVVTVNPSHFAVALRYRPGEDEAPVVVARGRGELALAIRECAAEGDVPILSYPALTRALYFTSKPGLIIHPDLYRAVATVLAFVLALDRDMAERAPPPVDVPEGLLYDAEGRKLA